MKTVTLLVMSDDERDALYTLRELGVMHIVHNAKRSVAAQTSADAVSAADRVLTALSAYVEKNPAPADDLNMTGDELIARAQQLLEEVSALEAEQTALVQKLARLEIWGGFERTLLEKLRRNGVEIVLCYGSTADYQKAKSLDGVSLHVVSESKHNVAFAAIFTDAPAPEVLEALPVFKLNPDDDPVALRKSLEVNRITCEMNKSELHDIANCNAELRAALEKRLEIAEFERAADAMNEFGAVSVLQGFVPVQDVEAVRKTAAEKGWGVLVDDPGDEDDVPVLIKDNRFTRIIKPLFDFLGIVPGYHELDVSGGVLVFFTIFYAIIVGDAGYGLIFSVLAALGVFAARKKPALKLPSRLLLILSIATTVWGALCGSWFGMEFIPGTKTPFPALDALRNFSNDTAKQANVQFFCFVLAVAQLSTGRIWKAIRDRNWRSICDNAGWTLIIWGNFFLTVRLIVYPGEFPVYMYYLYGAGLLLVMCCGVRWNQVADLFQFPFNIIGSFTDVLSYIRLFAVGLAGACIATSFNNMAFDVCAVSPWLLPAGALVVIFGHLLNIGLAFLGVLVHAVRLNTLEFSNHTGLSWSGQAFQPFKRTTKQQ